MAENDAKHHFKDVASQVNVDELELAVLNFWEQEQIFAKSLEQTKDGQLFTFYDGPPYATGKPHFGHALQSAIKDTVLRYKTMQGYYVPRRVGWDCHGLPVENLVEKELGIKTKKEIEDDIEGFNKKCREVVFRYIDDFTKTLKRIGRWADYSKGYATLDKDYMETEWWVFRQLWDQQLVYKDFRSTPYCIHCQTPLSNFEVSMAYADKVDTAVYVLLEILPQTTSGSGQTSKNEFLLVWTTTPWTLPANVAVAVSKDVEYVTVNVDGKSLVVGRERALKLFGENVEITKVWKLSELRELRYKPLYESNLSPAQLQESFRIVEGAHVNAKDGTGLVHMAPAFGEEDFMVAKQEGLPILRTVGMDGRYLPEVPGWAGKGIFAANKEIVADLKTRGLLFKDEQYKHSYPHCWRCDTPLIYFALDSWFLKVTDLKEQMLKNNEEISWVPEHLKHGRFAKGIESAPDWAISRNRFWSVPLPVWGCEGCGQQECVGSVADLKALSGASDEALADMHRPYVDRITWPCKACGKADMRRTPEVLDVWFDSGSMPYAQWHYPFANKEFVEKGFPADFIAESMEMTRAWFYVSHVLATALTKKDIGLGVNKPAFKHVIGSGLIFAENGQKLSKKLKNYPDIEPTVATFGADVLRMYLLTSSSLGEPYRFSERDLQQLKRNTYLTLWNVYSFFVSYANVHAWQPNQAGKRSGHVLDKWILARTDELLAQVRAHADAYHIDTAARLFVPFIDDLSNWYVRRSRSRFQKPADDAEKHEAFGTLHEVLVRTTKLLAPFMPFVAENMYQNLTGEVSVHLAKLPAEGQVEWRDGEYDKDVLPMMNMVRETVAEGLALRAKTKLKVRQPLAALYVKGEPLVAELAHIIAEEVNVKTVEFGDIPASSQVVSNEKAMVALDTALTPELEAEGMGREVIRHGQMLRREAGYALDDKIRLILVTEDAKLQAILQSQGEALMTALQALEILPSGMEDKGQDVKIGGADLHIGVKKV